MAGTGTILAEYGGLRKRLSGLSRMTKENQMKILLGIVLVTVMLVFGACQTTPQATAPAPQGQPGPAGEQGVQGQPGQPGQTGDTGLTGDSGHRGERGHEGEAGQPGEKGYTGNTGQKGDTGDRGKAAPCPAGQHRHTNPDNGRADCVED